MNKADNGFKLKQCPRHGKSRGNLGCVIDGCTEDVKKNRVGMPKKMKVFCGNNFEPPPDRKFEMLGAKAKAKFQLSRSMVFESEPEAKDIAT
jgi:hypothetical protein